MAVPSPSPKDALRQAALQARRNYARALEPQTREALEAALADRILPHLLTADIVAGYHPLRDEISPLPLLARLNDGQRAALPWFADRDSRMLFREGPAKVPGPWGALQPEAEAPLVAPDVLIVPLVLGDREGTRIGRGQGHYDRALTHLRKIGEPFAIGIAWDIQIADAPLPADSWDAHLDAIASPNEWIDCRRRRDTGKPRP
jgi:5-formyltetrahydrofolate cyclo-ligase